MANEKIIGIDLGTSNMVNEETILKLAKVSKKELNINLGNETTLTGIEIANSKGEKCDFDVLPNDKNPNLQIIVKEAKREFRFRLDFNKFDENGWPTLDLNVHKEKPLNGEMRDETARVHHTKINKDSRTYTGELSVEEQKLAFKFQIKKMTLQKTINSNVFIGERVFIVKNGGNPIEV